MPSIAWVSGIPWRVLAKLGTVVLLIIAGNLAAGWVAEALQFELRPSNEDMVHSLISISAAAYAVLLAIPFVPDEVLIGLSLRTLLG